MHEEDRSPGPEPGETVSDPRATVLPPDPDVPRSIGHYRLLERIGEGGMGEVWLADQLEPVRRQVAVKVIKAGMDTRRVVARFESERQALALMNHAAIAKVFDGGSTPLGRPYFVMEYIAGISITNHCDSHKLSTAARLELLAEVCHGVQHAHQKAIIHRDLKPSNILVTLTDGKAQPKIIDFGIAKATGQQLTDNTLHTAIGAIVGTPEYMSPEQADPSGEDVDTRTDVYSLGVILYELLTGELPFAAKELRSSSGEERLRRLKELEPPRPSARVSDPGPKTAEAARNRSSEPAALKSLLEGDLDAITMKALEKERARRYDTPSELAADLQRYLRREPVLAQPPSARYRARKYVQRNKTLVAGAAAVFVALFAGVIVSTLQAQRARRAERRAESEAAVAKATSNFLENDLLGQADVARQSGADNKPDPEIKVRELLDRAAAKIEGRLDQQPELSASLRTTIGDSYLALGLYPQAQAQLERALESSRAALGAEHPQTLKAMASLGRVAMEQGKIGEAEKLFSQVLESRRRVLGPEHPDTLASLAGLGLVYYRQNKDAQAVAVFEEVLESRRRVQGPLHRETLTTMMRLANAYAVNNKQAQALALYQQALEGQGRVLGPEHPDTLLTASSLSIVYMNEGRNAQAQTLLEQIVPSERRVLGPEHPRTLVSMQALTRAYLLLGKLAEAEALGSQTLELQRRVLGPEHPQTLDGELNLGLIYLAQGNGAQAAALLAQALEAQRRVHGPEHRVTNNTAVYLAEAWSALGKYAQAEALYTEVLEVQRRTQGPEARDTLSSMASLAAGVYLPWGRYAEAEAMLEKAMEAQRRLETAYNPGPITTMHDLARVYTAQAKFAQAQALFEKTLELERRVLGPDSLDTFESMNALALNDLLQARYAEAEALFGQTLLERRRVLGAQHPATLDTMASLSLAQCAQGKFAEGEALAREAALTDRRTRPDDWRRFFAESLLGANLMGLKRDAEAELLLREGQKGMAARKQQIAAPDLYHLDRAREWLALLHAARGKPARAAGFWKP